MATFPRAKLLRFNEVSGCAPPPGTYEPKLAEKPILGHFNKTGRFLEPKKPSVTQTPQKVRRQSLQTPSYSLKKTGTNLQRSKSNCNSKELPNLQQSEDQVACCSFGNIEHDSTSETLTPATCRTCEHNRETSSKRAKTLKVLNKRIQEHMNQLDYQVTRQLVVGDTLKELRVQFKDCEKQLKILGQTNENLSNKVKRLQDDIMEFKLQICTMRDNIDELAAVRNQLSMDNSRMREDILQKKNLIILCEIKVDTVTEELVREKSNNSKLRAEVAEISREIVLSKETTEKLTTDLNSMHNTLHSKIDKNKELVGLLANTKEEKRKAIQLAKEEHLRLTEFICLLQDQCDEKQKTVDALNMETEVLKSELSTLKGEHEKLLHVTAENLLSLLKDVQKTFSPAGGVENQTCSETVSSSTSQIPTLNPDNLIDQYLADLRVAVGNAITATDVFKERNSFLESEIKAKNEQIQSMEFLIGPFREQLEQYEQERQALSDMTSKTRSELEKIALQQAACLGHQNHKQKIKYLVQLKESNLRLRDEINELQAKLRQKDRVICKLTKDNPTDSLSTPRGLTVSGKENTSTK